VNFASAAAFFFSQSCMRHTVNRVRLRTEHPFYRPIAAVGKNQDKE